jgi:heterodisulfide reductase subunit A
MRSLRRRLSQQGDHGAQFDHGASPIDVGSDPVNAEASKSESGAATQNTEGPRRKAEGLVIGAGLAGMTVAHHLAEWGAHTVLIDRAPFIGGAFLLLDHTFTTDSCGLCIALPRQPSYCPTIASELHPQITARPLTTLAALEGQSPHFVARLHVEPRYVDPELCNNCGACAAVCPVTVEPTDAGRRPGGCWFDSAGRRKAIYPPPPRAVPFAYALDPDACTRCGACVEICPTGAIDLGALPSEEQLEVSTVVLAPGFDAFDAARAAEYGWGRCTNVLTSLEFERLLNRSGPTGGRVLRPSDGQPPRRIAFIHCVGSRSEALGRPYCSTSCCMITAKQVGLTREVAPETDLTVFTMDVRTTGKGYERYFQRVAALPGVTYRRGRPAAVHELPDSQSLRLLTPDGEEVFDLVVLAVGMGPAESVRGLADGAGVALDRWGFILPGEGGPGTTSRPGVSVAGSALAPADVPETVTQAEAAAALAAAQGVVPPKTDDVGALSGAVAAAGASPAPSGGSLETESEAMRLLDQPPRIGVFLCTCHGALEETLDFATLSAAATELRGVDQVQRLDASCEGPGLDTIARAVAEHDLNRIVVAGCSPHLYADRLDALMSRLGLPPRLLARANIREGAAWAFADNGRRGDGSAVATAVARGAVTMAVAGLRETPYRPLRLAAWQDSAPRVLVLGGGLAGMTAALTLSDLGVDCDLVERSAQLGGNLHDSVRTLDGIDARALLSDSVARVRQADRVRVWTETELVGWTGVRGDFQAQIQMPDKVRRERYGALIVATGAEPATTSEYLYGQHPGVVTQRELESRLADWEASDVGHIRSPAAPGELRSVVMIQCVGSRDENHPYCSRVCCAHAIKNALAIKALDPAVEVSVIYRDIRTMGTRELYYQQARRMGVRFLRYEGATGADGEPPARPVVDVADDGRLAITVHDTLYDQTVGLEADLVALSTGIVPSRADNARLAEMLEVELDEDGFFSEAHPKMRPTDFAHSGIFLCGMAYGPRFIVESMAQARAAALRAALVVAQPSQARPELATVEQKLCSYCGLCVSACPYGARVLDEDERFARVIDHLCQGCGVCVAVCPNGASRQPAFEAVQALAMVDAALFE